MNKSKSSKNFTIIDTKPRNNKIFLDTISSLLLSNRSKSKESIQCLTARSQHDENNKFQNFKQQICSQSPKRLKFNIKTFIRIKPIKIENFGVNDKIIITNDKQIICDDNLYSYDFIFSQDSSQKKVYQLTCQDLVQHFVKGFNATVFAYGQTGSGKTHTMFGNLEVQINNGIIPTAVKDIFNYIQNSRKADLTYTLSCSMLQIYRQTLIDLLTTQKKQLKIRQNRSIFNIQGLSIRETKSVFQVLQFIKTGNQLKKIRQTNMNEVSSRSHTIFTLYLETEQNGYKRVSKLNLIDLAGCQKVHKSKVQGEGLEEAKKINFSLACLGNTINALNKGNQHIPYRDSKLTRLLEDSLSGNSLTTLIVTCSLQSQNIEETLSSLKFASRAKLLKTNPLLSGYMKNEKSINRSIYQNLKGNYSKCLKKLNAIKQIIAIHNNKINANKKKMYHWSQQENNLSQTKDQISQVEFSSILKKIQQILQIDLDRNEILKTNYSNGGPNPFQLILEKNQTSSSNVLRQIDQNSQIKNQQKQQSIYNKQNNSLHLKQIQNLSQVINFQKKQIEKLKIQVENLKQDNMNTQKIKKQFLIPLISQNQISQTINNKNLTKTISNKVQKSVNIKRKSVCLNLNKIKRNNSNAKNQHQGAKHQLQRPKIQRQELSTLKVQSLSHSSKFHELCKFLKQLNQNYRSYAAFQKQVLLNQIDLLVKKIEYGSQILKDQNILFKKIENTEGFIFQSKYITFLQKILIQANFLNQQQNKFHTSDRNLGVSELQSKLKQNFLNSVTLNQNCV